MIEKLLKRIDELEKAVKELEYRIKRTHSEDKFWQIQNDIANNRLNIEVNYGLMTAKEKFQLCLMQFGEIGVRLNKSVNYEILRQDSQWEDWDLDNLSFNEFKFYLFWLLGLNTILTKSITKERESVPYSKQVWYLDFERDGDVEYGSFIKRLNLLAENKFSFDEVKNILKPSYGVKFLYRGKKYEWDFGHTDDWINWKFIEKLGQLPGVREFDIGEKNYYMIQDGQGGIIHYNTASNIERLEKILGLNRKIEKLFSWK